MTRIGIVLGILLTCSPAARGGEIEDLYRKQAVEERSNPDASRGDKGAKGRAPAVTEIGLERTPCLGTCPAFTVVIKSDGSVRYSGGEHAKIVGERTGKVSQRAYKRLARFLIESGYTDLDGDYDAGMTDVQSVYTTAVVDGKRKVVKNANDVGPTQLWAVEQLIEKLLLDAVWDEKPQSPK